MTTAFDPPAAWLDSRRTFGWKGHALAHVRTSSPLHRDVIRAKYGWVLRDGHDDGLPLGGAEGCCW